MNVRFASISLRTLLIRAAFVLVPIGLVLFVLQGLATLVVERSLRIAFGDADSSHGSAWYQWDGDIVADDVVIASDADADDAAAVRFDRVHVDTPGWIWVGRHLFDRKLEPSGMQALGLAFSGVHSGLGNEPTLGQLGPFGAISASPFEAEGCMQDNLWRREDLDRMGLSLGESQLHYDYRIQNDLVTTHIVLETPGASRVTLERTGEVASGTDVFSIGTQAGSTRLERWEIRDQGFVSARNRFCTKKDEIDLRRFIERHVEAVERILATTGLGADPDSRIAYRRFVRDGGTLVFSANYADPLQQPELEGLRRTAAVLARMDARIEHNTRGNSVVWQHFAPRPLPVAELDETIYATLSRERTAAMRGETLVIAATPTATGAAGDEAAFDSTRDVATTVQPIEKVAAPAATRVDGMLSAPTATAPASTAPDSNAKDAPVAEAAPAAATPADAVATNALPVSPATTPPPAIENVRPSPKPKAKVIASIAPPSSRRPRLEWGSLPNYRGRLVRIWTVHNPPRTVEILSGDASSVRVTARLGGGRAEYTIQREGFIRATLVQ